MTPPPSREPGGMAIFNILHAFPEALVRGMRSSFLKDSDYHHLSQCETLDDVRLNLSETDYAEPLADMSSLTPTGLQKVAVDKVRFAVEKKCLKIATKGTRPNRRGSQYWFYVRIQHFCHALLMPMKCRRFPLISLSTRLAHMYYCCATLIVGG